MAMQALVAIKYKQVRLIMVVVDRNDLASQASEEFQEFFTKCYKIPVAKQKTEQRPEIQKVTAACELPGHFQKLLEPQTKRILIVTLQSFPHLREALPEQLQEKTLVLADEVHRSHADRSFTEELERALGPKPRLMLFTGTASDRCLRLFGVRDQGYFVPFHAVSEEQVFR